MAKFYNREERREIEDYLMRKALRDTERDSARGCFGSTIIIASLGFGWFLPGPIDLYVAIVGSIIGLIINAVSKSDDKINLD